MRWNRSEVKRGDDLVVFDELDEIPVVRIERHLPATGAHRELLAALSELLDRDRPGEIHPGVGALILISAKWSPKVCPGF